MITLETISAAIGTIAGLAALCVVVTQALKKLFKTEKRWQNHLLSFCVSAILSLVVLLIGIYGHSGMWADFCVACWRDWIYFVASVIGCTLCSNGMWSYDIMKKFLELVHLLTPESKR